MSSSTLTVADVDAAITAVFKHQRYRLMDRDFTFADLEDLRDMRDTLLAEERAANDELFTVGRFNKVLS